MRKGLFVLLSLALVVALAVPASAEMKLTGFYRVKPTMSNFIGGGNSAPAIGSLSESNTHTAAFTEMRNRLLFQFGDDNIKGVTYFELDGNFGDTGGNTGRNQGFASNGDSINLETKNAYVWFKVPNTSVTFTVGLQGYSDEFAGLIFGAADQAGVVAGAKFDPVTLRVSWIKLRDDISGGGPANNAWSSSNQGSRGADYYAVDAKFNATPDVALTGHVAYLKDRGPNADNTYATRVAETSLGHNSLEAFYLGVNATVKLAPATLTGFFLYNFGTFDHPTAADVDIAGFAASVRADATLGPGKGFFEVLYVSGDDNSGDSDYDSIITGSDYANLTSFYFRPDLQLLFPNIDMINSARAVVLNPNNGGRGLTLLALGYSQKFSDKVSGKVGAAYLMSNEKRNATAGEANGDEAMATEFNANVNYNIGPGLDFGLYGAYALLGDFFDNPGSQPDDLYSLFGRLNYAF